MFLAVLGNVVNEIFVGGHLLSQLHSMTLNA
jgi:hypothetical protein